MSSRRVSFEAPSFSVARGGWGPRSRRRFSRGAEICGGRAVGGFFGVKTSRLLGGEVTRGGRGLVHRRARRLGIRWPCGEGSRLGGQARLGPPGSGSITWAWADAPRRDKAVLRGASSAAPSSSAPEEASNRPRTQVTGKVSHFARNQPSKARPSSAAPPSPDLRRLTGVRLVLRL